MEKGKIEEIKRHFGVIAEGLEHKIQLVAEGVANLNEKFDREITSLREENEQAHREILSATKFSYAELDSRIMSIGGRLANAQGPYGAIGGTVMKKGAAKSSLSLKPVPNC